MVALSMKSGLFRLGADIANYQEGSRNMSLMFILISLTAIILYKVLPLLEVLLNAGGVEGKLYKVFPE